MSENVSQHTAMESELIKLECTKIFRRLEFSKNFKVYKVNKYREGYKNLINFFVSNLYSLVTFLFKLLPK